jgi:hypothetical protein
MDLRLNRRRIGLGRFHDAKIRSLAILRSKGNRMVDFSGPMAGNGLRFRRLDIENGICALEIVATPYL